MSEVAQAGKTSSRAKAFFLVVLIFAVLGPAIGGLIFGLVMMGLAVSAISITNIVPTVSSFIPITFLTILFGYPFGIAYALIVGALVAAAGIWLQWNNIFVPLVASIVASVAGTFLMQFFIEKFFRTHTVIIYLPICAVAALVCWHVTRGMIRATWSNGAEPAQ
jgi:hypothetical protein